MMSRRSFHVAIFALVSVLTFASAGAATSDAPRTEKPLSMPFAAAEQLVYEGEFSRLLLRGIKIAELRFTVGRAPVAASNVAKSAAVVPAVAVEPSERVKPEAAPLLFTGDIESKGWFRKLFGINFKYHVESTVESNSFSVLRTTKLDEQGKRVRTSEAVFDRKENKVEWTERDPNDPARDPRVVTTPLDGAAHDIISAIYFLRTQPLAPGKTFDLTISDSGRIYRVPATVFAEKKKVKSVVGKVPVVRVDIGLFGAGRPVEGKGRMSLWITDDARHLPVRARISSDLGTLDITLKKVVAAAAQSR